MATNTEVNLRLANNTTEHEDKNTTLNRYGLVQILLLNTPTDRSTGTPTF